MKYNRSIGESNPFLTRPKINNLISRWVILIKNQRFKKLVLVSLYEITSNSDCVHLAGIPPARQYGSCRLASFLLLLQSSIKVETSFVVGSVFSSSL